MRNALASLWLLGREIVVGEQIHALIVDAAMRRNEQHPSTSAALRRNLSQLRFKQQALGLRLGMPEVPRPKRPMRAVANRAGQILKTIPTIQIVRHAKVLFVSRAQQNKLHSARR